MEQESIFVFLCWLFYVILSLGQCLAGAALAELPEGALRDGSAHPPLHKQVTSRAG